MNGFVSIWKKSGDGSTYAVGKVKKKLDYKCGHMGTLDPLACGVLPVGIGHATRMFDYLLDKQKTYIAEFEFGSTTDTLDCEGKMTKSGCYVPTIDEITRVLGAFVGEIEQVPPLFSAKMVAGKRGYDLARKGVEFTLSAKKVKVDNIACLGKTRDNAYSFKIDCRGGTYIRSLARDIATSVGTCGYMTALERSAAGIFNRGNSVTVEEFINSDNPKQYIIPADEAVSFPKLKLTTVQAQRLINGLYDEYPVEEGFYRVYSVDDFWGIGEIFGGILRMKAYVR